MKITLVKVDNYKKVKSIVLNPGERNIMVIAGKNKQGKSSLLDALSAAFGGKGEAAEIPVRKGEKASDIEIELDHGKLIIHKRFLASGSQSLEVRNPDGRLGKPQDVLNQLVGTRFLDPLKFCRLKPKDQREELLKVVDLGVDLPAIEAERKALFDDRTNSNRDVKRLEAEHAALGAMEEAVEPVSVEGLTAKLRGLYEKDKERAAARHRIDTMRREAKEIKSELDQATELVPAAILKLEELKKRHAYELAQAEKVVENAGFDLEEQKKKYDAFVEAGKAAVEEAEKVIADDPAEEISATVLEIKEAEISNRKAANIAAALVRRDELGAKLKEAEARSEALTGQIGEVDQKKKKALAESKMPIEGLSVDHEQVLYGDVPLSQASGAEQLRVSLAIAAALSPELQDIWVKDGALLDEDSMKLMHSFAKEKDIRIWLERVGDSDDDCIIIEEGTVLA